MKKIKLNKVKLALGLLGVIGATSLVAPILVSCGNSTPIEPEKPLTGITAKTNNDLTIWEMNAITADKKNWTVSLLSKAFDGINEDNIKNIKKVEVSNNIVTISNSIDSIKSKPTTNTSTILTKTMTDEFFAANGIWNGKTDFIEVYLKATTEIGANAFENKNLTSVTIPNTVTVIGNGAFIRNNFADSNAITISNDILDSTCAWNNKTVKENFMEIFGVKYSKEVTPTASFSIDPWTLNAYSNGTTPIPSTVEFLSTAFTGIDATNIADISNVRINSNNQITISYDGKDITSATPTLSTTVLTKELVDKFFAAGGIWAGKTTIVETELKGTTQIGEAAFAIKKLVSVIIPNTVTIIGGSAFAANEIASLTIPNSVTFIGHRAFMNNKLTEITIPNSVEFIGFEAFQLNKFSSSKKITIGNTLLDSICNWKYPDGTSLAGDGKTVRENFNSIFLE